MYNNQLSKLFLVFPPKRPESRVTAEISAGLLWSEAKRAKETTTSGGSLRNVKSTSCDATKGLSLFLFLKFFIQSPKPKTLNSILLSLWKNFSCCYHSYWRRVRRRAAGEVFVSVYIRTHTRERDEETRKRTVVFGVFREGHARTRGGVLIAIFFCLLFWRPLRTRQKCICTSNATPRDDGGKFALPSIHFGPNWDSKHAPRGYETGIRARGIWSDDARETRIRTSSPLYGHVTLFRSVLGSSVVPSVRGVFHMRVYLLRMV